MILDLKPSRLRVPAPWLEYLRQLRRFKRLYPASFLKYMEEREEKRQARFKTPQNWHTHWVFEILPPWRNLNTLGFRLGDGKSDLLYMDFFLTWANRLGIYINLRGYQPRKVFLP